MSHRPKKGLKTALGAAGVALALSVAAPASAATFKGTVTDGTNPLAGICVRAYNVNAGDAIQPQAPAASTTTLADGTYTLSVIAGSYKLGFVDCANGVYATQFARGGKLDLDSATPIQVLTDIPPTTENATMALGGAVSGAIYEGDGDDTPVPGACVALKNSSGGVIAVGEAGADGAYRIAGVPAGSYGVRFLSNGCPHPPSTHYVPVDSPNPVTVAAGGESPGVNGHLVADTVAPTVQITGGPTLTTGNAVAPFSFTSNDPTSTFSCSVDAKTPVACTSPWHSSALGIGAHAFSVTATDENGNTSSADTRTWVYSPGAAQTTGATVPAGGTATSDPGNDGVLGGQPFSVAVTSPTGGSIAISLSSSLTTTVGSGWMLFGREMGIVAPDATMVNPLKLVFTIAPSALPSGADASGVIVFRDGVAVAPCAGFGNAAPDPCMADRQATPSGGAQITVLSSHASVWNTGVAATPAPPTDGGGKGGDNGGGGGTVVTPPSNGGTGGLGTANPITAGTTTGTGVNLGALITTLSNGAAAVGASQSAATAKTSSAAKTVTCNPPSLKRHTLTGARTLIKQAHCALGTVTRKVKAGVLKNRIYSQSAAPGRISPAGRRINVVIAI